MNNTYNWIIAAVVVIVLAVGAYLLLGSNTASAPQAGGQTSETAGTQPAGDNPAVSPVSGNPEAAGPGDVATVTHTDAGFSPATVTIKAGESVMFANDSNKPMWVASAMHPTHSVYDGNNLAKHCAAGYAGEKPFDQCGASGNGTNYTFTFAKPGTWKYHNHSDASEFGTVIVTE